MPVTFVQEADAGSANVTLGTGTTAGNTVLVAVACLSASSAAGVTGITLGGSPDNFTNVTPGPSAHDTTAPGDYLNVSVWADAGCAGGSTAITVTGTGVVAAWAWEFSGLTGTADAARVLAVATYQDSWLATAPQTTVPAEAWIAVTAAANQAGAETLAVTSGNGWTTQTAYNGTSGSYFWGAASGYQTVNTIGTPAFNGNFSQPSFSVTAIVTLGAGTPPVPAAASAPLPGNVAVRGGLTVRGTLAATGTVTQGGTPVSLTPVGPKTGNYAARPGDFVLVDCSHGAVTVTLPAAPANGSLAGVKLINSVSGALTVNASGADVIDAVPAATTSIFPSPQVIGTTFVLQYQTATGTWYTQSTGTQLPPPPALNAPQPSDAGFAAWSYDYTALAGTFTGAALLSGGNAYLVKCPVRAPAQFSSIRYWITAAGSGLTPGENFLGVYTSGGSLIAGSTDLTSTWGSTTGMADLGLGGPFTMNPPHVWAVFLCNGTTGPAFAVTGNQTAAWANGRLGTNSARFGHLGTTNTSLPSSFSLLGIVLSAAEYWVGLY